MPRRDGTGPPGWGGRRHGRGPGSRSSPASGRRGVAGAGRCGRRACGERSFITEQWPPPAPPEATGEQELNRRRAEEGMAEEQIGSLRAGTGGSPGSRGRLKARIDTEKCLLCSACEDICPNGAITVGDTVVIAAGKCSGCGACVRVCPNEAIRLV